MTGYFVYSLHSNLYIMEERAIWCLTFICGETLFINLLQSEEVGFPQNQPYVTF